MTQVPVRIREMEEGDRAFVATTMTRSICDVPAFRWVPPGMARRIMAVRVGRWLKYFKVAVASAKCDDTQLVGFIAYSSTRWEKGASTVLYAYVKDGMRRMGVGRELLTLGGTIPVPKSITALHWSRHCESLCQSKKNLMYAPSLLADKTVRR